MALFASQFLIQFLVINNVVAMHASGSGLEIGRAIHMRDAESLQIGRDPGRIIKGEAGIQLQSIGRAWNPSHASPEDECESTWTMAFHTTREPIVRELTFQSNAFAASDKIRKCRTA